ncbi:MAG TPA: ABC transporter permease, partial [Dehalococcoidales bacterium]
MKRWLDPLVTVWIGISTHKLRSFLTMLGIVIGVASVIILMSIGRGSQAEILSRIQTLGSDRITISAGAVTFGGVRGAAGGASTLTLEDAEAIAEGVSYIAAVAPTNRANLQAVAGSNNTNTSVIGTTPEYMRVTNLELASGTFISESDYQSGAKVAVLGSDVKETLFGEADAVGQKMRLGTNIVYVIGVLESKGSGFNSPDDTVLIPLTAMQQMVSQSRTSRGEHVVSSIDLTVSDEKQA